VTKEQDLLLVKKEAGICTMVINRPEKRNALNPEILSRIVDTLRTINEDEQTRVAVLRGAGEQAFSAGFDISRLYKLEDSGTGDSVGNAMISIENCTVPVIAMIYGYCIGASSGLAISCDLRLAADNARLGITAAKLGVLYPPDATNRLVNLVGISTAKELLYTGDLIDAERAREIKLVDRVVPKNDLANETYKLAREIADNSPLSVRGAKRIITKLRNSQAPGPEVKEEFMVLQRQIIESEDFKEGKESFSEKRKPGFKGK
jgi:enoyl-CoA hydratase/carnithine racemase